MARGYLREAIGDREGAAEDYVRYLELAPDDPAAERVRARLQGLAR